MILVDVRNGVVEQSRRHAFLSSLLRVPHVVMLVNKMDLVDYDQAAFERVAEDFRAFAAKNGVRAAPGPLPPGFRSGRGMLS